MKLKARAVAGIALMPIAFLVIAYCSVYGILENPLGKVVSTNESSKLHEQIQRRDLQQGARWSMMKSGLTFPSLRQIINSSSITSSEQNTRETDRKLLEDMLRDDVFQQDHNVETFLRVAHLLEEHRNKQLGILPKSMGIHIQDPEKQHQTAKIKTDVHITDQILGELQAIVDELLPSHRLKPKMVGISLNLSYTSGKSSEMTNWQKFHKEIRQFELYSDSNSLVDDVLHDLTHLPLTSMYQLTSRGTQIKFIYYFSNRGRALFKPMRFKREQETLPDHFYFDDYERHTAEIAAFHLDRILGFHRVPPGAGRLINITHDISRLADKDLLKTIYVSPAGNLCFYGECEYFCDSSHPICGHPDTVEGYFAVYLPSSKNVERTRWRHPWRRSYSKFKKAFWETHKDYCREVRRKAPYNSGRRLLDVMDLAVFDFLQGNLDRHHYETLTPFGNFTSPLHMDNGKGFGKTNEDFMDALAPVYQCCLMRYSTLVKVMDFHTGTPLSDRMRDSLSKDSLTQYGPILTEGHLTTLDRRVRIILKTVHKCIQDKGGYHEVVLDDGF